MTAIENNVRWIPAWGKDRIHGMIENRPDWCISAPAQLGRAHHRPALRRAAATPTISIPDWAKGIAAKFADFERGCDYWFEAPMDEIVPKGLTCPKCGASAWKRETDILDVWFDSGTSFAAVLEKRDECSYPADMYLEGSDQHRGWFHSSLLASIGTRNQAPYRSVLTHGYVVDGEGKKMSKSVGNVIAPQELIDKFGAEILRMWVSSVDYRDDIRISDDILNRLVDAYRRIRNTCRFLLGNLKGFDVKEAVAFDYMHPLDRWMVDRMTQIHKRLREAYTEYEFHRVYHTIHNLCVTELSSFYLDIVKDRLYASAENDKGRRSAQTAIWRILLMMVQDMAPIMSFTAEEVYRHLPEGMKPDIETVFALRSGDQQITAIPETELQAWDVCIDVRAEVTKAIEPHRKSGAVGHSLNAHVTLYVDDILRGALESLKVDLKEIFIVSKVTLAPLADAPADAFVPEETGPVEGLKIGVAHALGDKCERCWIFSEELGTDPAHPALCPRCTAVLQAEPPAADEAPVDE